MELKLDAPELLLTLPPSDIVVRNEQPEDNIQALHDDKDDPFNSKEGVRSHKVALILDLKKLDDKTSMPSPLQSGMWDKK
jgi:hypothetical protein